MFLWRTRSVAAGAIPTDAPARSNLLQLSASDIRADQPGMKGSVRRGVNVCHTDICQNSGTGTRARVARVRAKYPNQLDYTGAANVFNHVFLISKKRKTADRRDFVMDDTHKTRRQTLNLNTIPNLISLYSISLVPGDNRGLILSAGCILRCPALCEDAAPQPGCISKRILTQLCVCGLSVCVCVCVCVCA